MTQTIQRKLNDSAFARWTALVLIALMMFFAYMFVDMLSPLKSQLETSLGWDGGTFGTYAASEYFLNVFCFFLIFAGIILDKMGIRFTGLLSASLMVIGAAIKFYGMSDAFLTSELNVTLTEWGFLDLPGSALVSCLGFMIFGCGCEMAGTTVSKAIAKWFKGKEMAMAMGLEMSIARLGVFAAMWLSPFVYNKFDSAISAPVAFGTVLLLIGLIFYFVFVVMDRKFDKQLEACGELEKGGSDDEFKLSDLGKIFKSKMFWLVALLCVLYYSAIFPFQRFAPDYLATTLDVDSDTGAQLFSCFPILAMVLTPFLGGFIDRKGKAASMLMVGSLIMIACHLSFAFLLPAAPSKALAVAIIAIL